MIATESRVTVFEQMQAINEWLGDHREFTPTAISVTANKAKVEFGKDDYQVFRERFAGQRATRRRSDYGRLAWLSVTVDGIEFEVSEPALPATEELDL